MGESSPAIRLLIPLAKRAITNNINWEYFHMNN